MQERSSLSTFLQYISGANLFIFWGVSIIWDLLTSSITTAMIIVLLILGQNENWRTFDELATVWSVLTAFYFCMIPIFCISSMVFTKPATGVNVVSVMNIAICKYDHFTFRKF